MSEYMRKRVLRYTNQLDLADVFDDKTAEQAKAVLDTFVSGVSPLHDAMFRVEYGYEYTDVFMDVFSEETDAEYQARLAKEEEKRVKSAAARERKRDKARAVLMASEAAEREEYLRLKAKFEEAV